MQNVQIVSQRNQPCPCGKKYLDGTPKKYKVCCEPVVLREKQAERDREITKRSRAEHLRELIRAEQNRRADSCGKADVAQIDGCIVSGGEHETHASL